MTLVILAAGMGSRYGGLKQIDPIGPCGEFIIDYSIYDAIGAGFDKVVFIIKKENENLTILSITHDQEEANISDRVIVINEGKVIYNDIPSVVFSHQEELEKMGLEIPFFDKLKQLLIKENIDVKDCNNLLEVKNKLCQ